MDDDFDDFFSKKDKSKKKSKKKFVAADLLPPDSSTVSTAGEGSSTIKEGSVTVDEAQLADKVQDLDLESKEKKKSKKKKAKDGESKALEDDEWNVADDQPDYTGLKIATKNISRETELEGGGEGQTSDVDDSDENRSKQPASVWSKPQQTEETVEEQPPTPQPVTSPVDENPNVVGGRYVPPSKRNQDLAPVSIKKPSRRQPKVAPNINNPDDFPTLGGPSPPADYDPTNFEKVRGGGRMEGSQPKPQSQRVETSNMYSALEH